MLKVTRKTKQVEIILDQELAERIAALAGIAVSAAAVAMGLTGVFDDAIAITYTTCSRPH